MASIKMFRRLSEVHVMRILESSETWSFYWSFFFTLLLFYWREGVGRRLGSPTPSPCWGLANTQTKKNVRNSMWKCIPCLPTRWHRNQHEQCASGFPWDLSARLIQIILSHIFGSSKIKAKPFKAPRVRFCFLKKIPKWRGLVAH